MSDEPSAMKVLIAGGAGYIGSTVASACLDAGVTPVILDNLITGRREFADGRNFYAGDIADGALLDRIFAEHPEIEATIHCAALIVVPDSAARPLDYYRENVSKSVELLAHLVRNRCGRYIFSSSASIYSPGPDFAVDEASPLEPGSPYARTKVMMEMILEDAVRAYDLRAISLRYFNPIGADPRLRSGLQLAEPSHALGKMITAARTGATFTLTGTNWPTRDGTGIRDYVHVWDLALAHVAALRRFDEVLPPDAEERHLVINLGTGSGVTVRELLAAVERVLGRPLHVEEGPPRPGDVVGSFTRSDRARELLGWEPRRSLDDGIRDALAWAEERERRLGNG